MPVDIASLRKRGVTVPVEFYGATINVEYDPIKVANPAFRKEYNRKSDQLQHTMSDWMQGELERLRAQELREDFPGRDELVAAGCESLADIPADLEELQAIDGVDERLARRIQNALNRDLRLDNLEISEHIWRMRAELVAMLVKDWDITVNHEPLPVSADVFLDGTLPPELSLEIINAVWRDIRSLGNRTNSNGTS